MAGCSSIWVIAEKKYIPLMKTVVGSYVEDPILAQLPVEFKENFAMKIPIWYTSVPVKDMGRRDCYGFSVLTGADYSIRVSSRLSKQAMPEKFYVSFPQSVYSPWILQKHRKNIKNKNKNFYFYNSDGSFKDDIKLGFTFFTDEFFKIKKDFKTMDKGAWEGTELSNLKRRPIEERNSALKLTLDQVFRSATLDGAVSQLLTNTNDISSWDGYVKYIRSERHYRMPKKVKYFRYSQIKQIESRLIECGDYDDYNSENEQ